MCRSVTEVADDIQRAYAKVLRDPQVVVKIVDRSNRPAARLDGAVKMAMRFSIRRPVRLRELIVAAGGFADDTSGDINIFRPANSNCSVLSTETAAKAPAGNGFQTINITISELLAGKESADPVILSGDVITVEKAQPVYLIGAVNDPRPVYSRSGMTLTHAIAMAGGLAKGAVEQTITVFRRSRGDTNIMQIDLEKIKNGELNDVDLKPFDIIEVAFKGHGRRKYPPVVAIGDKAERSGDLPLKVID